LNVKLREYEPEGCRDAMETHRLANGAPPQRDLRFFYGALPAKGNIGTLVRVSSSRDGFPDGSERQHVSVSVGHGAHGTASVRCPTSQECEAVLQALGHDRASFEEDYSGHDPHVRHFWES
jgi:hypothetical protein